MSKRGDFKHWFNDECDEYRRHSIALNDRYPKLFEERSPYQQVEICNSLEFGGMLVLDGSPQSAERDERIYHESLVHPAGILLGEPPKDILILGGGEGATAREALRYKSARKIITVDIDRVVVDVSRRLLAAMREGVDKDERSRFITADAKEFLVAPEKFSIMTPYDYDLIFSDINDSQSKVDEDAAARCYAPEFFEHVAKRLRGIFVMQSQELSRVVWRNHKKHRETLKQFFKQVYSYRRYVPSFNYEQSFILASNAGISDPRILQPQIVDYLIRDRISGELEEYSGDMHAHLFALSPYLKQKLEIT